MTELTQEQLEKINNMVHKGLDDAADLLSGAADGYVIHALEIAHQVYTLAPWELLIEALKGVQSDPEDVVWCAEV